MDTVLTYLDIDLDSYISNFMGNTPSHNLTQSHPAHRSSENISGKLNSVTDETKKSQIAGTQKDTKSPSDVKPEVLNSNILQSSYTVKKMEEGEFPSTELDRVLKTAVMEDDLLTAQTRTQPQTDKLPLESVAISIPPSISTSMDNMKSLSLSSSHSKSLNQPSQPHQTSLSASGNNPNYQLQHKHTNTNKITDLNSSGSSSGKKEAEVTNQFKCPDTFEQFIHSAFQGVEPDNMTKLSIGNDGFRLPALDCNSDIPKSTKNSAENLSASFTALNISSSNNINKQSLTSTESTTFPSESPNSNLLPSNSLSKSNHLSSTSTLNGQSSLSHPSNSFKSGTNSLSSSQVQLHSKAGISSSPSYLSAYQQPQRDNNTPTFKIARRKLSLPVSRRPSSNSNAAATKPSTSSQKLEVPKSQLSKVKSGSNEMIQTQDESNRKPKKALLPKCNSCSTLFVNSTMSKADLDETLRCVSIALHSMVVQNHESGSSKSHDIFSEELYPLSRNIRVARADKMPSDHDIYLFLNSLFEAAQLTADCAIITLIYVERMLINTDIAIQAGNWARVILGGLVLASKVWDDQAVWNVDFCTIFPDVRVRDMNILERFYINAIHYNVSIKASLFAKYYFDLRDLATQKQLTWSLKPLTVRQATRLEAITSAGQSRLMDATGSFASVQIIQTNRNAHNDRDSNDNENGSQNASNPRAENSASEYSLYQSKSTLNQNSKSPQVKPDVAAPASLNQSDESGSSPRPPGSSSSNQKEKLDPKSLRMPNTGLKVVVNVGSLRRAMSDHIFEPPSPAVIM